MLACLVVVVVESGEEWRTGDTGRQVGGHWAGRWRQTRADWAGLGWFKLLGPCRGSFGLQAAWNRRGGYDVGASLWRATDGLQLRLREGCERADRPEATGGCDAAATNGDEASGSLRGHFALHRNDTGGEQALDWTWMMECVDLPSGRRKKHAWSW
jgi:hypothetical protein